MAAGPMGEIFWVVCLRDVGKWAMPRLPTTQWQLLDNEEIYTVQRLSAARLQLKCDGTR